MNEGTLWGSEYNKPLRLKCWRTPNAELCLFYIRHLGSRFCCLHLRGSIERYLLHETLYFGLISHIRPLSKSVHYPLFQNLQSTRRGSGTDTASFTMEIRPFSRGWRYRSLNLTTHFLLATKLRICGSIYYIPMRVYGVSRDKLVCTLLLTSCHWGRLVYSFV
jgi:hypothetical protein